MPWQADTDRSLNRQASWQGNAMGLGLLWSDRDAQACDVVSVVRGRWVGPKAESTEELRGPNKALRQ